MCHLCGVLDGPGDMANVEDGDEYTLEGEGCSVTLRFEWVRGRGNERINQAVVTSATSRATPDERWLLFGIYHTNPGNPTRAQGWLADHIGLAVPGQGEMTLVYLVMGDNPVAGSLRLTGMTVKRRGRVIFPRTPR